MSVNLTNKQIETVNRILELRRDASAEQIVDEALEHLLNEQKLEHLRAIVGESILEEDRGEFEEMSPEFDRSVRKKAIALYRRGDAPDPDTIP
jgi:diphthamide biosynthesis methyltransferase